MVKRAFTIEDDEPLVLIIEVGGAGPWLERAAPEHWYWRFRAPEPLKKG
jgi:hypothetical protein